MSGMFTVVPIIILGVAVVMGVVLVVSILRAVRDSRAASQLSARGQRTTGRVIAANAKTTGGANDTRVQTELIETIEFETSGGQRVSAGRGSLIVVAVAGIVLVVFIAAFAWNFLGSTSMMNPPGF